MDYEGSVDGETRLRRNVSMDDSSTTDYSKSPLVTGHPQYTHVTSGIAAMYSANLLVSVVAIILSSTVLVIIARSRMKKNTNMYLAANLCVADLLGAIAAASTETFFYLKGTSGRDRGSYLAISYHCGLTLSRQVWEISAGENLFTILLMTVNNFVTVRWPHSHEDIASKRNVAAAVITSWIFAIMLGMVKSMLIAAIRYHPQFSSPLPKGPVGYCILETYYANYISFDHIAYMNFITISVVTFVFISMVIVYSYVFLHVWWKASRKGKRSGHDSFIDRIRSVKKTLITTLLLFASFVVCWLPFVIYSALDSLHLLQGIAVQLGAERLQMLKMGLGLLVSMNGVIDPFLYCARIPSVRSALKRALFGQRKTAMPK